MHRTKLEAPTLPTYSENSPRTPSDWVFISEPLPQLRYFARPKESRKDPRLLAAPFGLAAEGPYLRIGRPLAPNVKQKRLLNALGITNVELHSNNPLRVANGPLEQNFELLHNITSIQGLIIQSKSRVKSK